MPLTPGDYEVNDPVNGQNVNKQTVELTAALDKATEERDAEKEAQIRAQLLDVIMEEAERENPVAVINLGMRYLEGSDQLPKDIPHAIPLIVKAEQMGVRYASYLLHLDSEEAAGGICRRPKVRQILLAPDSVDSLVLRTALVQVGFPTDYRPAIAVD